MHPLRDCSQYSAGGAQSAFDVRLCLPIRAVGAERSLGNKRPIEELVRPDDAKPLAFELFDYR